MDPVTLIIGAVAGLGSAVSDAVGAGKNKQRSQIEQRTSWTSNLTQIHLAEEMQETYTRLAIIIGGIVLIVFLLVKIKK